MVIHKANSSLFASPNVLRNHRLVVFWWYYTRRAVPPLPLPSPFPSIGAGGGGRPK